MNAPVIVFTYNRPDHLKKTLHALERARGARQSRLYLFADGWKGESDRQQVLAVHEELREYEKHSLFAEVHAVYSEQNRGLAESVIAGVGGVIENEGKVIVVEDDLIVSEDFLEYMNAALDHYKDHPNAWAVSGWCPDVPEIGTLSTDTFLWYRSSSWGWATWLDRWRTIDWDMREYPAFRFSVRKRRKMNRGGADMADMLDMQMQGKIHSWAIRFAYAESMKDMLTVFPKETRVVNCGRDGSGTNCHDERKHPENGGDDENRIDGQTSQENGGDGENQTDGRKHPGNSGESRTDAEKTLESDRKAGVYNWGETLPGRRLDRKIYRSYSGSRLHCLKWRIKSILNRMGIKKF
ncbi:MAG: hypothetical protein NC409_03085 [Clostridium sp.]|nr:hypothetical protein [Clostridium sp.]